MLNCQSESNSRDTEKFYARHGSIGILMGLKMINHFAKIVFLCVFFSCPALFSTIYVFGDPELSDGTVHIQFNYNRHIREQLEQLLKN